MRRAYGPVGWSHRASCRRARRPCGCAEAGVVQSSRRSYGHRATTTETARSCCCCRCQRPSAPPAAGLSHNCQGLSTTIVRPVGRDFGERGILVTKRSGATSICGWGASAIPRVSLTANGMSRAAPLAASTARSFAAVPEQDAAAVGVQSMCRARSPPRSPARPGRARRNLALDARGEVLDVELRFGRLAPH